MAQKDKQTNKHTDMATLRPTRPRGAESVKSDMYQLGKLTCLRVKAPPYTCSPDLGGLMGS